MRNSRFGQSQRRLVAHRHRWHGKLGATHRTQGACLDTREVLEQVKVECDKLGYSRIILVAHRIYAPRANRVAKKLGFTVEVLDTRYCELDLGSTYWWVRSDWIFTLYEKFLSTPINRWRG